MRLYTIMIEGVSVSALTSSGTSSTATLELRPGAWVELDRKLTNPLFFLGSGLFHAVLLGSVTLASGELLPVPKEAAPEA